MAKDRSGSDHHLSHARPAAREGLIPDTVRLVPTDADIGRRIMSGLAGAAPVADGLGPDWELQSLVFHADPSPSHFLLRHHGGASSWLVRHIPATFRALEEQQAELLGELSGLLNEASIAAVPNPIGGGIDITGGFCLFLQEWFDGQFLPAREEVMFRFGRALAELHDRLGRCSGAASWRRNTMARVDRLNALRAEAAAGRLRYGPIPDLVQKLARQSDLHFDWYRDLARPLHGDLNPGNVLDDGRRICFLDFEDCRHSFLAPILELMFVLERFVLVRIDDVDNILALGIAFLKGYGHRREWDGCSDPALVMKSLALRSLLLLVACSRDGNPMQESEWKKFAGLVDLAEARREVLMELIKQARLAL